MMRKLIGLCLLLALLLPLTARAEETVFQPGDRVVIWHRESAVALSGEPAGNYLAGVRVTPEDGSLVGYGEKEIWILTQKEDGSWQLENGGLFLSLDSQTLQLTLGGEQDSWQLLALENDAYRIVNRDALRYLTWYSAREVYGTAAVEQEQNILEVYLLPPEEETTEPSEETEMPTETPTQIPTESPTEVPTEIPTEAPTEVPTELPTEAPTEAPTEVPTELPTEVPTEVPTEPPIEPPEEPGMLDTGSWRLFFGQLHAHTADSDGMGTVAEAFSQAEAAGLDFFGVTDHSDSFDNDKAGSLTTEGTALSREWAGGKAAADAATDGDFVGIYGFEMSWNQGQGHISTFNTPGWLSRDQADYQKYKDGLENYYDALLDAPQSISQFNHPGTLYGDFKDFAYDSPQVDALVTLIEVGSGAGREYQTAYTYYTRALDQGWHLAPTNNQNNHAGGFGSADTNRTVALARELTRSGICDALRNYRVYATEDADLQIYYTLNGYVMGSEVSGDKIGDTARLSVALLDATDEQWGTVEVITKEGAVAASAPAAEKVSFSLPATAAYYYIRVVQPDGDVAVTAPVWIRQREDLGISSLEPETVLTRAGEAQTIRLELYNNEAENLTVTSVELTDQNGNLLGTAEGRILKEFETLSCTVPVCFATDGVYTLTASVQAVFEGTQREFTKTLELSVLPMSMTADILIDGTHGGQANYEELTALAAEHGISVLVEMGSVTGKMLEKCRLFIVSAPTEPLEAEFLELIESYVNQGGNLLLLGIAGGSEELNKLLEAVGSDMSLNPDTAVDAVSNGGTPDLLFTGNIRESVWTEGFVSGQIYAHVGGCTLSGGEWLVKSLAGEVLLAAENQVLLAGSHFLADEYLQISGNSWALPYANRTVAENLLGIARAEPRITPIGQVRTEAPGRIYLIEGRVTAGTHNVNTTFPDTIYVQDDTGGIAAVGYSEHGLELGRRVRITGCPEGSDGNPQLRILHMEILEKQEPVTAAAVGNAMDYASQGGKLLRLEGIVISAETQGEAVLSFILADETGARATVWIGEGILSGSLGRNELARIVREGNRVSAVGLCHMMNGAAVLRIRDCDEVALLWSPPEETVTEETAPPTEAVMPSTEPLRESSPKPPSNGNPSTGDAAFPDAAPLGILVSLAGLWILRRRKNI